MFPVRHVAADFCSKGACEVIATTPHSAAHTGGADFLGTVEPHWARFALSGVWPMALAEPAAGERCRTASSSPTCLHLLAGTLPAWPQNQWPAADSISRINSFDVRSGIAGCRRGVCRHSISLRLSGGHLSGVFAAGCPSSSKLRRLV